MDTLPPELCTRIALFACRDTGYTGRSLSIVSKYVRETSQAAKFQSIAIHGSNQIIAFAALLERTRPHLRCVRYLFVSSHDLPTREVTETFALMRRLGRPTDRAGVNAYFREYHQLSLITGGWMQAVAERAEPMAIAFESVLGGISSSLEVLGVDFHDNYDLGAHSLQPLTLPNLTDLAIHGPSPLAAIGLLHQPILAPCHSLRRLHIASRPSQNDFVKPQRLLQHISVLAPFLTHLRLSGLQEMEWLDKHLWVGLGHTEDQSRVGRLPETIEMVLIHPQTPKSGGGRDPSSRYHRLIRDCHELQAMDGRVCLLQPYTVSDGGSLEALVVKDYDPATKSDWLNYINGGEGCWDASGQVQ